MSIWIMGDTHYSTGDEKKLLNLKGNINDYAAPMDVTAQIVPFKYGNMCNSFQYLMDKYPKVEWHLHVDTKVRNCYVHYEEVFKVGEF